MKALQEARKARREEIFWVNLTGAYCTITVILSFDALKIFIIFSTYLLNIYLRIKI